MDNFRGRSTFKRPATAQAGYDIGFVKIRPEDEKISIRSYRVFIDVNRVVFVFSNKKRSISFHLDPNTLSINEGKDIVILNLRNIIEMIMYEKIDSSPVRMFFSMILCSKRMDDKKIRISFRKMFYEYILYSSRAGFLFTRFKHFSNFIENAYNSVCDENDRLKIESEHEYEYEYEEVNEPVFPEKSETTQQKPEITQQKPETTQQKPEITQQKSETTQQKPEVAETICE
jgi:hypothetical protein